MAQLGKWKGAQQAPRTHVGGGEARYRSVLLQSLALGRGASNVSQVHWLVSLS